MVDVGGGMGSASMTLARAFPHLRLVVADREDVVTMAPQVSIGSLVPALFGAF